MLPLFACTDSASLPSRPTSVRRATLAVRAAEVEKACARPSAGRSSRASSLESRSRSQTPARRVVREVPSCHARERRRAASWRAASWEGVREAESARIASRASTATRRRRGKNGVDSSVSGPRRCLSSSRAMARPASSISTFDLARPEGQADAFAATLTCRTSADGPSIGRSAPLCPCDDTIGV